MSGSKSVWCKIILLSLIGALSITMFVASLTVNYQVLLSQEHVRFRKGMPSQDNWIKSPYGTLNCYLFNVTNFEEFLNRTDTKLKLKQVGPIVYRIKGKNEVLNQTETSITYRKLRYHNIEFDPVSSCSPNILNQTIVLPNLILLGAAAKFHDWIFLVRHAFNAITINEPIFLKQTIHHFLWEFTTPALNLLSSYVPNIVANCGMLHNALRKKNETYNVKIGLKNDLNNFFRVNSLNNMAYFPEQAERLKVLKQNSKQYCPVKVVGSFDNSLFPPFIKKNDKLTIVAGEACRTHRLKYNSTTSYLGFQGYRYTITDQGEPNCLETAMGVKLHRGMFDVSKCLFNDVPSAFSLPHFYGSSYNWSQHFEGLSPNILDHETFIVIEPISGIPIEEKYRFQSNMPLPDMTGYNKDLARFSHMVLPTFWYEYDMDDLPSIVLFLMRLNVFVVPVAQPIMMGLYVFIAFLCFIDVYLILKGIKLKDILFKIII